MKNSFVNYEIETYKWWSKTHWFIILILFSIGILCVTQVDQTYPIFIFVASFVGIGICDKPSLYIFVFHRFKEVDYG